MKLKAVLYDFDMTLVDTSEPLYRIVNEVARRYGRPHCPREKLMSAIGNGSHAFWAALLGDYRPEYDEIFSSNRAEIEARYMHPAVGAIESIYELKARGVRVGCASNRDAPAPTIHTIGLDPLLECIVGASDVPNPKPAPDVILKGAELLGASPSETLYIGDTPIDVRAAVAAQAPCVALLTSSAKDALQAAGANWIIPDLTGLISLLESEGLI